MKRKKYSNAMMLIEEIAEMSPETRGHFYEKKIVCPYCHEYTLLLKAGGKGGPHYYCIECGAEGPLEDIYHEFLGTMMEKPRGVSL
jgi:predicted RNA-binding Zn-ribbon protein involved in translation (DUF1610 family)